REHEPDSGGAGGREHHGVEPHLPSRSRLRSAGYEAVIAGRTHRTGQGRPMKARILKSGSAEVRRRGDAALIDYTRKFDGVKLSKRRLRVADSELKAALRRIPTSDRRALELAASRIAEFHRRTLDGSFSYTDSLGMRLGQLVRPLKRVGIYVPGGLGAYPSSVLMNAIPARVAGVEEIVMVSPPSREGERDAVMAAASIGGVTEYYRVGGAHAVAALAYGTDTIRPVDKIVGPGNAYVQAAKRMVYG